MPGTGLGEPRFRFRSVPEIKIVEAEYIKLFLLVSLAAGFLSAVADRFVFWPIEVSAWGPWDSFVAYTSVLNPWAGSSLMPLHTTKS